MKTMCGWLAVGVASWRNEDLPLPGTRRWVVQWDKQLLRDECIQSMMSPTHTHIPSKQAAASVKDKRHVITKPQIAPLIKVLDNQHRADDWSSPCWLALKLKSPLAPSPSPPSYSQLPSDCQWLELSFYREAHGLPLTAPQHMHAITQGRKVMSGGCWWWWEGEVECGRKRERACTGRQLFLVCLFFIESRICESEICWLSYKTWNTVYPAREHSVCAGWETELA